MTFCLKDQSLTSFSRLSFEYEVRSLIIANIQRYCTGKNVPFLSHGGLDLKKIDMFLLIDDRLLGDDNGVRTEMTLAVHEVVLKNLHSEEI